MGLLSSAKLVHIGEARGAGHLYHFTDVLSSLWCVYIDAFTGRGIIKRSRDQGRTWMQVDDVGPVDEITIRGKYAGYRRGARVALYDIDEGFEILAHFHSATTARGQVTVGSGIIPVPELGSYALDPPRGDSIFPPPKALYNTKTGTIQFTIGGNHGFKALWGTQNNDIKDIDFSRDMIYFINTYQDPFTPQIVYDVLFRFAGGGIVAVHHDPLSRAPVELPMYRTVAGSGYEGFVSSRNSLTGCSPQVRTSSPSSFLPADHWQEGRNTAPLYVPSLAADLLYDETVFPVHSTPSGVQYDNLSSRAGVTGFVGGFRTFGLIEPGNGLALCRMRTTGEFFGRKFLGTFPAQVNRQRTWMPYSNGIFGMGVVAHVAGVTRTSAQSLFWVLDTAPDDVPSRLVNVDGKFEVKESAAPQIRALRKTRSYDRW